MQNIRFGINIYKITTFKGWCYKDSSEFRPLLKTIRLIRINQVKFMDKSLHFLKAILLFYQKIFFPAIIISSGVGIVNAAILGSQALGSIGIVFIFFAPLIHFFIYELMRRKEYYFYYNLGLSKITLWLFSISMSLLIGICIIIIL